MVLIYPDHQQKSLPYLYVLFHMRGLLPLESVDADFQSALRSYHQQSFLYTFLDLH